MTKFRGVMWAMVALATLFADPCAEAGPVIVINVLGSQGFNATLSPNSGSINQQIDLNDLTTNESQSGYFDSALGTPWGSFTLSTASSFGQVIVIDDASFGKFEGTIISDATSSDGLFRNVLASGIFTPGTDFDPLSTSQADLSITLTKSAALSVISATVVLDAWIHGDRFIPEPSSLLLAGLGALVLVCKVGRRARCDENRHHSLRQTR